LRNSETSVQVIAIDNGSVDGTIEKLKKDYSEVELIETGKNLGFGKANNIGLKRALDNNIDYIFLLNQDAWIEADTISKLIVVAKNNAEFGILSPIHLNAIGDRLDFKFKNYLIHSIGDDLYSDLILKKDQTKAIYNIRFVNAAAWLIRSEILRKIGGFDPLFSHYGEDDDYINRLIYHKYKVGIVAQTYIYHDREERKVDWNMNRNYISELIELKNINTSSRTKYSQLKKEYSKNKIRSFLTVTNKNKKIRLKERKNILSSLLNNYEIIVSNRERCMIQQPNFLEGE